MIGNNFKLNYADSMVDVMTYTLTNGEVESSSTPRFIRKWRKIFGCKHSFVNTRSRWSLKDRFCTKCWAILDEKEFVSLNRENRLNNLGI